MQSHGVSTQPAVIITQPGYAITAGPPPRAWSSGLCSCCDDISSCLCFGLCCGHCYLCCSMYPEHNENCCAGFCNPVPLLVLRVKHRARHNIEGTICDDLVCQTFCWMCTGCQLSRDMKYVRSTVGYL